MPEMDGVTLLTKIKETSPDTQVILMTAFPTIDSAILALKHSAASYLRKPFELDDVVPQANHALEKYKQLEDTKKLIEELRYAKEYNEKIIENLIYTLIVIDEQGNIKKINRAMEDLLGYTQKDIIGKPAVAIFTEAFKLTKWNELLKEKKIKDFPVEFLAKDGQKISALFSGTLMRNSDGAVAGLIGTTKSQQKKV
jgi:PAS domain S-box-containing protein